MPSTKRLARATFPQRLIGGVCLLWCVNGLHLTTQAQPLALDTVSIAFVSVLPPDEAQTLWTQTLLERGFLLDVARMSMPEGRAQKSEVYLKDETKGKMDLWFEVVAERSLTKIRLRAYFTPELTPILLEKAADPGYRPLLHAGFQRYVEVYLKDIKQRFVQKTISPHER